MKLPLRNLLLLTLLVGTAVQAQISHFQHVIVIVQENRTPDNLFQALCLPPFGTSTSCSTTPTLAQYDIKTSNWLDKHSPTGFTQPAPVPLGIDYDLGHSHLNFTRMCDKNPAGACLMDGAGDVTCNGTCPTKPQFKFVQYTNTDQTIKPYLELATQYGWANYLFQTNQGPSFPAHQFLFGGTSAPNAGDDAIGTFAAENTVPPGVSGCIAAAGTTVALIDSNGNENQTIYPCFEHQTVPDLAFPVATSWRYYAPGAGSIWTAPNAISHICQPNMPTGGQCVGADWVNNVDLTPADVLTDIGNCALRKITWVIPTGPNSDHAGNHLTTGGPSWVASIVNAIGNSWANSNHQCDYWGSNSNNPNDATAIFITWDDWGGWYDHEAPTILPSPQGGYQYGFRVPLVVVSAYTPHSINNVRHDFGSILRFIEQNFGVMEGALNFADLRSNGDLTGFFKLTQPPRSFQNIMAPKDAKFFLEDKTPSTDPDDD